MKKNNTLFTAIAVTTLIYILAAQTLTIVKLHKKVIKLQTQIEYASIRINHYQKQQRKKRLMTESIRKVNPRLSRLEAEVYAEIILKAADKYNLSPQLLYCVIVRESGFRFNARSKAGCLGLMQVNPAVWPYSYTQLMNPVINIDAGAKILKLYLDSCNGNLKQALKKYSAIEKDYYWKDITACNCNPLWPEANLFPLFAEK